MKFPLKLSERGGDGKSQASPLVSTKSCAVSSSIPFLVFFFFFFTGNVFQGSRLGIPRPGQINMGLNGHTRAAQVHFQSLLLTKREQNKHRASAFHQQAAMSSSDTEALDNRQTAKREPHVARLGEELEKQPWKSLISLLLALFPTLQFPPPPPR